MTDSGFFQESRQASNGTLPRLSAPEGQKIIRQSLDEAQ